MAKEEESKLAYEVFFKVAIVKLREKAKSRGFDSRGIHAVYSGFNDAFRIQYPGEDPIKVTQALVKAGMIEIRPAKNGVMIYLPGEAPPSRTQLGEEALQVILGKPPERDKALLEKAMAEIISDAPKIFPDDFFECPIDVMETVELNIPGTPLLLDPNSQTTVISPKRRFRYAAKNPPEAKYIVYSHKVGQEVIKIPTDHKAVFKAVTTYERYCDKVKEECYSYFLKQTHDETTAEVLVLEAAKMLNLRAKKDNE